jgi:hypothetical protein
MKVGLSEASVVLEMVLMDTLMLPLRRKLAARVGSLQHSRANTVVTCFR